MGFGFGPVRNCKETSAWNEFTDSMTFMLESAFSAPIAVRHPGSVRELTPETQARRHRLL
jgi:hypothetical protein